MNDHRWQMRFAGILAILFVVCMATLATSPPPGYERIRTGMSKQDVEALLGPSTSQSYFAPGVLQSEQWNDSDFMVHVQYDALTGTVTYKKLFPKNPASEVLFRLREEVRARPWEDVPGQQ